MTKEEFERLKIDDWVTKTGQPIPWQVTASAKGRRYVETEDGVNFGRINEDNLWFWNLVKQERPS